jgi:hypothetical protein
LISRGGEEQGRVKDAGTMNSQSPVCDPGSVVRLPIWSGTTVEKSDEAAVRTEDAVTPYMSSRSKVTAFRKTFSGTRLDLRSKFRAAKSEPSGGESGPGR